MIQLCRMPQAFFSLKEYCFKPIILFLALFVFLPTFSNAQVQNIAINANFQDQNLKSIFDELQSKYAVSFYYQDDLIKGQKVSGQFVETPIEQALESLLESTDLGFRTYRDYAFIVASKSDLQKKYSKEFFILQEQERIRLLSATEETLAPLVVGDINTIQSGNIKVKGFITDDFNKDIIVGATLLVKETGTGASTDGTGQYQLSLPAGTYQLVIQSIGYQASERTLKVYSNGELDLELAREAVQLEEVVVSGNAVDKNVAATEMGVEKLDVKQLKKIPAFLGEADLVKSLLLLPGVSTVGEGAGGFNVRGGTVDQNLIMQDGAFMFNTSHVLGFFSVFNPDVVKNVTLYKGSIPARYGGRLSAVLDVDLKEGNFKEFTGKGGLGVVSSRLVLEGPLKKGKNAFILGVRSSYSDWVLNLVNVPEVRNSSAFFYDANVKFTQLINDNSRISFSGYSNKDRFQFEKEFAFDWETQLGNIEWKQIYGSKLSSTLSLIYSNYRSGLTEPEGNEAFNVKSGVSYIKIKPDFIYTPNINHKVNFGIEAVQYTVNPGETNPVGSNSEIIATTVRKDQGREMALYLEDEFTISPRLSVIGGVRFSLFQSLGEDLVFSYQEGVPKNVESIVDSTAYSTGEVIKTFNAIEPRISVNFKLSEDFSIKAGYNRTAQYINQISNTASISPVDIWQMSNTHIKPQIADSYSIGFFKNFNDNKWETSLEFYYRDIDQLIDYKDFAQLLANEFIETELLDGIGRNYGIELSIRRKVGQWSGWFGYTYSKAQRKIEGNTEEETVNQGNWYNSNYDKPHDLTVVSSYQLNRRNNISMNFTYSSGRPTSVPVRKYTSANVVNVPDYSFRNQFRIPDYYRLDFSWTLETSHRKKKAWESSWTFSVYNVLGRKNAYSVFYRQAPFQNPQAFRFSVLGSAFPALTYNFKF